MDEKHKTRINKSKYSSCEVPSIVHDVLSSSGQPFASETMSLMETKFGHDFSQVRIHTDEKAAESAAALNALAYTAGDDLVFGSGMYSPQSSEGQKLLEHELAHVVQNERSGIGTDLTRISPNNHSSEQQAETASRNGVATGLTSAPAGIALQRKDQPDASVTTDPNTGAQTINFNQGSTVTARGGYDPETQREMDIARGAASARTRAMSYLTQHKVEIMAAVNAFKTSAQGQISAMPGDPSDYWALLPALAGAVGAVVTAVIPGVNIAIGSAIAVAVQAAVQGIATAEVKSSRGDAKQQAIGTMNNFASAVDNGQASALRSIEAQLQQRLLTLSVTDDNVRMLLEGGNDNQLDEVIQLLGIPNPAQQSPYGQMLEALESQFAAWLARQQFQQGMTTFERMVSDAEGTESHAEMQSQINSAQEAARERARASTRQREER